MLRRYIYILLSLILTTAFSACQDEPYLEVGEQEIVAGEKVMFTSYLPEVTTTRSAQTDFQDGIKNSYNAVGQEYTFTIKMYKQGVAEAVGSAQYKPTVNASATGYMEDGTLTWNNTGNPLYWDDNVNRYGFEATAGTVTLGTNQKTTPNFLAQDKLHGYAYEPLWEGDPDAGRETDRIDMLNYRTSREWYLANQQVYENFGQMPIGSEEYKKIPLFLQHERAMITVILKADEGVSRDQLKHATSDENIETHIISYGGATESTIDPLPENTYIDYVEQDYGGAATHVETMEYHAIVEPYNYLSTADEKPLCTINLSGQKFSYYASNDKDYRKYTAQLEETGNVAEFTDADAKRVANAYNLTAGKHLIITATLSRESRKIVITAYVEDWTEKVTTSICDDYGKNGDPVTIETREQLLEFLDNPNKNKAGTVAIISPTVLDLEKTITTDGNGNVISTTYAPWPTGKKLNCMLNLAGAVIYTEHELFSEMASSANLVNGTIVVRKNKTLSAVVTEKNEGTIERVDVRPEALAEVDDPATTTIAKVTQAGLVNQNYGTIFQCSSSIPVQGTTGYVGGIAAESLKDAQSAKSPVISDCTVTARVDGTDITAGGGIVGNATGRVTGNTFSYGMTVLQTDVFKNIIGQSCATTEAPLTALSNSWPTTVVNDIAGTNDNANAIYAGVIDRQEELAYVLKSSTYNVHDSKILIAADFAVNSQYWSEQNLGKQDATLSGISNGNVFFELDGNDKMITLKGTKSVTVDGTSYPTSAMLFTNIQNSIHDLTLVLEESLIAAPSSNTDGDGHVSYDGLDAIAPLGYSVYGATLSNIKVKTAEGKYIQAAMPGGIVAWAYGNAKINQCEFMGKIQTWLPSNVGSSALRFAGGIAASAEVATFNQCMFHTSTGTFVESSTGSHTIYAGGIVGGIYKRDNNSTATPLVTIKDCASQFSDTNNYKKGAIVGRAQYDTNSTGADQHANGLNSAECEGNWWGAACKAVGQTYNYMTDIKALGVRNSVNPTFNSF